MLSSFNSLNAIPGEKCIGRKLEVKKITLLESGKITLLGNAF